MLAPEEGHRVERLALSQHVVCGGLSLALRHHPMLDADILTRMRVGPARDIARRVDAGNAGLEISVDDNAAIELEACLLGKCQPRTHPDANHDQVRFERSAALERGVVTLDRRDGIAEMEDNAMLLVQPADEIAHLGS